ncbi:MAG: hypothetical protein HFF51_09005 [Lawsonibacter sp.]|nr:hypothetical protein [Lawsonibacter sp.]
MTLLNMSLGGGVLIAVILVLRRALLHRLPKWTFLLLWGAALCRLLVPFTLPSQLSVYTGAAWIAEAVRPVEETPAPVPVPAPDLPFIIWEDSPDTLREDSWTPPAVPVPSEPRREPLSLLAAVWLTGTALCGVFFGAAYLWTLRRFWDAVPAEAEFLRRWREEHPTLRPVQVRTCGAVNAPVAYGLIRPVILLPENTNWTDEDQLTYILTHEYVHICRGDLLWKLLLTAALCLHWVNPLVWVMYFRANRDLELACDEAVVRTLGLDSRKGYAYALLSAAESGFSPLCLTYTTKNHMEERIRAIMKMKKKSVAAILAALTLTAGVTAVFATSKAPEPNEIDDLPQAVMSDTVPKPALGDKSNPGDRVHPITQGDTSTPVTPADTSAPDDRVHPVTDQPGDTPTEKSDVCTICTRYYDLPEGHLHPDAKTPNPANCWGIPDGPIAADTEIFAHNEEEFREMIRQLRLMGYNGYVGPITYKCGKYSAVIDAYDGVRRTITPPEGIMPDWTYPVNSKGMTYGNLLMGCHILGYYPDLFSAVATNGAEGYMTAEDALHGQGSRYPVYDLEYENIVGYFETGNQISSEVQEKIDELKNRWNVPADPIPEGTEFTVSTVDEMNELCDYLHNVRGIKNADIAVTRHKDGSCTVSVAYYMTKQEEEAKKRLANGYPVNSKGQTYGFALDSQFVGEHPDLVAVEATNGKSGYILWGEYRYLGYTGRTETAEDMMAFIAWQETQPDLRVIPVYDVNRDNLIGYYEINLSNDEEFSEDELKWLEDGLRRAGIKEEDIAREIEKHRAPKN